MTTNILTNPIFLIGSVLFGLRKPITARLNKLLGRPPALEPGEVLVTLDHGMPQDLQLRTLQDYCYNGDCGALDSNAAQLAALGYPLAASELRTRAAVLRARLPSAPAPVCSDLDPTLDARTCSAVRNALWYAVDPAAVTSFAASLRQTHPRAAALLDARAAALKAMTPDGAPVAEPAPVPSEPTAATAPSAPLPVPAEAAPGAVATSLAAPIGGKIAADTAAQLLEDAAIVAGGAAAPLRTPGHFVTIRATDRIRADNLAKIGSGGEKNAGLKLIGGNPHLVTVSGVLPEFLPPGAEVAVPDTWAGRLRERGFQVARD